MSGSKGGRCAGHVRKTQVIEITCEMEHVERVEHLFGIYASVLSCRPVGGAWGTRPARVCLAPYSQLPTPRPSGTSPLSPFLLYIKKGENDVPHVPHVPFHV